MSFNLKNNQLLKREAVFAHLSETCCRFSGSRLRFKVHFNVFFLCICYHMHRISKFTICV